MLYEIIQSKSVDKDKLKRSSFQKICAERSGQKIDSVKVIYINDEYVKDGDVNPHKLFIIKDVTAEVKTLEIKTTNEVDDALEFLQENKDLKGCSCLTKTRGNHCVTFRKLNPTVPEYSIYDLPRAQHQIKKFAEKGIFDLAQISTDMLSSPQQIAYLKAVKSNKPIIETNKLQEFIEKLEYPIYFLDYETFDSAVPIVDGIRPHEKFPVQFSLHIQEADDSLKHEEYLEDEKRLPDRLIEKLEANIGNKGSIIVWNKIFERDRNIDMGRWFKTKFEFFKGINSRLIDLQDPFKTDYVDKHFRGKTSIKDVLPVICPGRP